MRADKQKILELEAEERGSIAEAEAELVAERFSKLVKGQEVGVSTEEGAELGPARARTRGRAAACR
jgi:hypothetical protein